MFKAYTATAADHVPYPGSGVLLGQLVDALLLKEYLLEGSTGCDERTVRRMFSGERVEKQHRRSVIQAVVHLLTLPIGSADPSNLLHYLPAGLEKACDAWDDMAEFGGRYPLCFMAETHRWYAPLRFVALDTGLRLSGWRLLAAARGMDDLDLDEWLQPNPFGRRVKQLQKSVGTNAVMAKVLGVTTKTLQRWKSGKVRPSDANLHKLAAVCAGGRDEAILLLQLRIRTAVGTVLDIVRDAVGKDLFSDLVAGMKRTAALTTGRLISEGPSTGELHQLVVSGARSPLGKSAARALAELCWNHREEVAVEFAVLDRNWGPRIHNFAMQYGGPEREADHFDAVPREHFLEFGRTITHMSYSLRDFDTRRDPLLNIAELGSAHRVERAKLARIAGDIDRMLKHLDIAVALAPQNPTYHFMRGGMIGEVMATTGRLDLMQIAIDSCRMAYSMRPAEMQNALNEVAIILSNARRHEQAEIAYEEASACCSHLPHHHSGRGGNLLALGRWTEAAQHLERSLELMPDNILVRMRLAAALQKTGEFRAARKHSERIQRSGFADPLRTVDAWADPWGRQPPLRSQGASE